jgi:glutamyl-Q tRNA(Asp) synthetase
MPSIITRFAPSPTGRLHLGHVHSAFFASEAARRAGGRFLLRIEDIDVGRCKPEFEEGFYEDLRWLGLNWEEPVRRQSDHMADYQAALSQLQDEGLIYPCFCTRAEIRAEAERAGGAPHTHEGPIYPGTCRALTPTERESHIAADVAHAWRLDMAEAAKRTGKLTWKDQSLGVVDADPLALGDVVLARKDIPTSYHLSVTVDDHVQGVNLITRGHDLAPVTPVHRVLQALLGFDEPEYHHHPLISGPDGRRLAKREQATTIQFLRDSGLSPEVVRNMAQVN